MKPGRDADGTAKTEADHHMKCPGCGQWLTCGVLAEIGHSQIQNRPLLNGTIPG
jgi:hypothetical protein